jgi:signal transduction histidine kinase/ActR/RegA family two-component response regulator
MVDLGFAQAPAVPGVHVCQVYGDSEERLDAVLRFASRGLRSGEATACFSDLHAEELEAGFAKDGLSLSEESEAGHFTLSKAKEVYFQGGNFDPDRMLGLLSRFYEDAVRSGRSGARVIGEMSPEVTRVPGGSRLLEYESRVNELLREHPIVTVCQFDPRAFDGATIMDLLTVHPMMVVHGAIIYNPFYVPPEQIPWSDSAVSTPPSSVIATAGLRSDVLAKLLLIQNTASQMRDEAAIIGFVCRGLQQVPGVSEVRHREENGDASAAAADIQRFPLRLGRRGHGAIEVQLARPEQFQIYAPHVSNLVSMVAVMLEEREQRLRSEFNQRNLEVRVQERTRLLSEEVRERRAAEATAIAERRRADQLLQCEQAARVDAQQANAAKDQFLAVVSHELRNPLAPVLSGTQLLRRRLPDEDPGRRALDVIDRSIKLQARLIDDLLDLSRAQRDALEVTRAPVALGEVLASALDAVRPDIERGGLGLVSDVGERWVLGDADRIYQVVLNLLSNAVKFTPRGGEVRLRVEEAGDLTRVVVEDSGAGIDPALLPHLFELFNQGKWGGRRNPGLGIGLALVKTLVEKQGGRVWAESAGPGTGSRFIVELPTSAKPSSRQASQDAPTTQPLTVLVVEDNPDARLLLEDALGVMGHAVKAAASGEEALEMLRSLRPDVLLLDIGLPGMNGYDLLRCARALAIQAPAFAVTGLGGPEDLRRSREAGFAGHFVKPVDLDDLDRHVRAILRAAPSAGDQPAPAPAP